MGSFLLLHSSNPGDNVSLIHAMEEFKACQYYWEVHRLHFSTIYSMITFIVLGNFLNRESYSKLLPLFIC